MSSGQPRRSAKVKRGRVAVADDDPYMRDLLVAVLDREGYEVISFADGKSLIDRLRDDEMPVPDVIITDVVMPGVDGFGVLREVERLNCHPAVILITAFGDALTHRRGVERGAVEVVDKPFDLDAIRALVARVLAR